MSPHVSALPLRPSLALLKDRARQLRKAHAAGEREALRRFQAHHPGFLENDLDEIAAAPVSARDAQLAVAREHGFENWAALKRYVEERQGRTIITEAPGDPGRITQTIPFFAVSDIQASRAHYEGLGFRLKGKWEPDGELRWCSLGLGGCELMMQQHYTQGRNARIFDGQRGAGISFLYASMADIDHSASAQTDPLRDLHAITDDDGFTLLTAADLPPADGSTTPINFVVPVLRVTNSDTSREFYVDGLGFEAFDMEGGEDAATCLLRRDDVALLLQQDPSAPAGRGQGVTIFHLCEDAVGHFHEFTARGVRTSEPYVGNGMWVIEMSDPDGYRLSFESPTDAEEETTLTEVAAEENDR